MNPAPCVWILGSYGRNNALSITERDYAKRLAERLGSLLASAELRVVTGESDLLVDLCNAYRHTVALDSPARAITIHGSLRAENPVDFLATLVKATPTAALLIGGTPGGRASKEALRAHSAGLPIGGFRQSGGAASSLKILDATWNQPDSGDAAHACMNWLKVRVDSGPPLIVK